MNKIIALAFAVPLALAAGCGKDAKSCTITTSGTTKTLTCPDGTSTVIASAGAAGANGESSLANVVDEPAGTNCPNGGKAIETGLDTNGNGVLDPSEVTATSYVCDGGAAAQAQLITGDVVIANSADIDALKGVTTITGTLTIVDRGGMTAISLPDLQHVGAIQTDTGNATVASLSMPALTKVDNDLILADNAITTLDFSALTSVNGLFLYGLSATDVQTFAKLATVGEDGITIAFSSITSLTGLEGALASTPSFQVYGVPIADLSAMDSMVMASTIQLNSVAATTLKMSKLTKVNNLAVYNATNLTSVELDVLASGSVQLNADGALTTVDIPMLPSADVHISSPYPPLKSCTFSDSTTCPNML